MLKRTKFFLCALFTFCMALNVAIAHAEDEKQMSDATGYNPMKTPLNAKSNVVYGVGVPVGTVVAWPYATLPNGLSQAACVGLGSENEVTTKKCEWLICDGSSINQTAYPALFDIMGQATLPNLKGRFLEGANGAGAVKQFKEAGLPNITGTWYMGRFEGWVAPNGAVQIIGTASAGDVYGDKRTYYDHLQLNAAVSSAIYGRSPTVQPASYTVNYLIKAY